MSRTLACLAASCVAAAPAAAAPRGVPVPPADSFAAFAGGAVLFGDLEGGPRLVGGGAARRARFATFGYRTVRPAGGGRVLLGDVFDASGAGRDRLVRVGADGRVDHSYGTGGRLVVRGPRGATFTLGTDRRGSAGVVFRRDENAAGTRDTIVAVDSRGRVRYARTMPPRFVTYAGDPAVSGAAVAVYGTSRSGRPELALATPSRLRIVPLPAVVIAALAGDGRGGFVVEGRSGFVAVPARGAPRAFGRPVAVSAADTLARDAGGRLLVGSPACVLRRYARNGLLERTWRLPRRYAGCQDVRAQAAGGRVFAVADYAQPDPAHDDTILHPLLFRLR